ncbi:MAG TPA: 6-phosphogluconolactonase [Gammaproteobacteria bacterium]|nr:6-phosphogluconolactonase [Gammaproteobacteria bacterium]
MQGERVHVFDKIETLNEAAAHRIRECAEEAVADHGAFHVALAGGQTPVGVYETLRRLDGFPWERAHVYLGDERNVPGDHPDSNYRMARESLLDHVPVPAGQVHPIDTGRPPDQAAAAYAELLQANLPRDGQDRPRFDLVLLGMGADGHVASLFPDTDILRRRKRLVAAVYVEKLETWRISLTLPAINAARHVALLVAGDKKADVVRHVFHAGAEATPLPVQLIRPEEGPEWFLDAAAGRHVTGAPA